MQLRTILIGVLALVFAVSAAAAVYVFSGPATPTSDTVGIVVLKENVVYGKAITPDVVELRQIPKDAQPAGAILKPADAVDRVVIIPMVKGDPLLETKLAPKGTLPGIQIEEGYRAFTIQVSNTSAGVGGFIRPGSYVDVMLISNDAQATDAAKTLLQAVKVLAVDQLLEAPKDSVIKELRSVTLQVEQEDAERLAWGQARGTLSLSLRRVDDKNKVQRGEETVDVVVAKTNLAAGKQITADMLEVRQRPRQLVPADALFETQDAVGRVTRNSVLKGDLVVQSKLASVTHATEVTQGQAAGGGGGEQQVAVAPAVPPVIHMIRGLTRGRVTLYPRPGSKIPAAGVSVPATGAEPPPAAPANPANPPSEAPPGT